METKAGHDDGQQTRSIAPNTQRTLPNFLTHSAMEGGGVKGKERHHTAGQLIGSSSWADTLAMSNSIQGNTKTDTLQLPKAPADAPPCRESQSNLAPDKA